VNHGLRGPLSEIYKTPTRVTSQPAYVHTNTDATDPKYKQREKNPTSIKFNHFPARSVPGRVLSVNPG